MHTQDTPSRKKWQLVINPTNTAMYSIYAYNNMFNGNTSSSYNPVGEEHYLGRIESQFTIPPHAQAMIMVRLQATRC